MKKILSEVIEQYHGFTYNIREQENALSYSRTKI